jgi:hypothetical protein
MRLCKLALVLGAVALVASPVFAQGRGRGGFGGGVTAGMLINAEKVQKDLGLDADGVKKAQDALAKVREDNRDEYAKLRDASAEERTAILKKINEANEKALKGVLSEKQMKRLKQIELQQQGTALFNNEDVQKALKLDDKQKDQLKEINKDLDKELAALRPEPGTKPDFSKIQENMKKMQDLRKDAMTNATKVLNDDQKKQLKEMTGEHLELSMQDLFGGRGRGGKPDKPRTDF